MLIYAHPLVAFRVNLGVNLYLHVEVCKFTQTNIGYFLRQLVNQILLSQLTHILKQLRMLYKCRPETNFQPARHVRPCCFVVVFEHSG